MHSAQYIANLLNEDNVENIEQWLDQEKRLGIAIVTIEDQEYPSRLREIPNPPPVLHYFGNIGRINDCLGVAVIGARKADKEGCNAAYELGAAFGRYEDANVISGLAMGCDAAAHRGALSQGGFTTAVVATGLDKIFPRENASLQQEIIDRGSVVISEYFIGGNALPSNLVARNRIQAALSDLVIVAQCPKKSGTLHTVRFAKELGRRVVAVEFDNVNLFNEGNRNLIADGVAEPLDIKQLPSLIGSLGNNTSESKRQPDQIDNSRGMPKTSKSRQISNN